ncbi:MAG: hypothetical protein ACOCX9_00560 [Spirochaetota bacterium]
MDLITMDELKTLVNETDYPCISIYIPTHRAGLDTGQDPIRLKNLLQKAENGLKDLGYSASDIKEMIDPARDLLQDQSFWRHQSDGLALFISPGNMYVYRVPVEFKEELMTSGVYYLKPLIPYFTNTGRYMILGLSKSEIMLFDCTRYKIDMVDLSNYPINMRDTLKYFEFEKQLQFHTGAASAGGERAAVFHGHDVSDEEKEALLQWFQRVNTVLGDIISNDQVPIVPAGVEYLVSLFRKANTFPGLVNDSIQGAMESLSIEELHSKSLDIMEPLFKEDENKAIERYNELKGTGKTLSNVEEVVTASFNGRIDILMVRSNQQVWGNFDRNSGIAQVYENHQEGSSDLLNLAVIQTLVNSGDVYILDAGNMPQEELLAAAVLRY